MTNKKRSIVKWTDEQFEILERAAKRGGYASVPAYIKIKAMESAVAAVAE